MKRVVAEQMRGLKQIKEMYPKTDSISQSLNRSDLAKIVVSFKCLIPLKYGVKLKKPPFALVELGVG